ncbi:MAG: DUF2243 domain-containing protein [Persicimonas sp.]
MQRNRYEGRALVGAIFLGLGFGGFFDGIVFHHLLQWHHMLSSVVPPDSMEAMRTNMRWDGYFHAFSLLMVLLGTFIVYSAGRKRYPLPSSRWLSGWLIFGWGLFNLVEGILNHHILQIHTVRYQNDVLGGEPSLAWALTFLILGGVGLMLLGYAIARTSTARTQL